MVSLFINQNKVGKVLNKYFNFLNDILGTCVTDLSRLDLQYIDLYFSSIFGNSKMS